MVKVPKNVTIIGGGIAGVSISRLLSKAGINNRILERGSQLCGGATWHAAGLVTRFAGSSKIKKIHVRSLEIMNDLQKNIEGGISLHTPGSIRIIEKNNKDRLFEAKQHLAMASLYDDPKYKTELISPSEIKFLHPFINVENIEAGLYTPFDGDVDPTQLTNCLAKEAKHNGTEILFNQEVININKIKNEFIVNTRNDDYVSDTLINCGGLWSRNISNMLGLYQPTMVIEHQYVITENIPITKSIPVIRDLKGSSYIRKEGKAFLIGPYENDCNIKDWNNYSPPSSWGEMDLFPDNLERISDNLVHAMELIPCIGEVGIKTVINGPTIWAPDSLPRIGLTSIPGYYDFNSLTYGIAQSLGLSEYLFKIITNEQTFDATGYFNPSRYDTWADNNYVKDKIIETYSYNNKISYPFENRSAGNHIKYYPLYEILQKYGGKFGPINNGYSIPLLYDETNTINVSDLKTFYNFPWTEKVIKESQAVINNVGLSYSSFSKIKIQGNDAKKFLDKICISNIPIKEGSCKLAYFVSDKGNIIAEFTICPIDDYYYLVGNGSNGVSDTDWLKSNAFGDVKIYNKTNDIDILHIAGPNSYKLLSEFDSKIKDISFMKMNHIKNFANKFDVKIFKLSFTGYPGYELHIDRNNSSELFEYIKNHEISKNNNLSLFGSLALNSLRIERGFKTYGDFDFSHYLDAGITPFISKNKKKKIALNYWKPDNKISSMFKIKTDKGWEWSVVPDTPIFININYQKKLIGYITSSTKSATFGDTIGLGFIDRTMIDKQNYYINCFGDNWDIEILKKPLL